MRNKASRLLCAACALLLTLSLCLCAGAEGILLDYLQSAEVLLFAVDNATLKGQAVFELDAERFKTVDFLLRQAGGDSEQQILLSTPLKSGEELASGYTVIANGDTCYVMEVYHPGQYMPAYTVPSSSFLRTTIALNPLLTVVEGAVETLEPKLGDGVTVTKLENGCERLTLKLTADDVPPAAQAVLNLLEQYAAERYFFIDRRNVSPDRYLDPKGYLTTSEGILYTLKNFELTACSAVLERDTYGQILSGQADLQFKLYLLDDSTHTLTLRANAAATDYGTTKVEQFDPDAYGVVSIYQRQSTDDETETSEVGKILPAATPVPYPPVESEADAIARVKAVWSDPEFHIDEISGIEWMLVDNLDGVYTVAGVNEQTGLRLTGTIDRSGVITELDNACGWKTAKEKIAADESEEELTAYRKKLGLDLERYADLINPGSVDDYLSRHPDHGESDGINYGFYHSTITDGENEFILFYSEPDPARTHKSFFVLQTVPVQRLVHYEAYVDPAEGGNG